MPKLERLNNSQGDHMKSLLSILMLTILASPVFAGELSDVKRIAYCKINRNRIMIYEYTGSPTTDDMIAYVDGNTPSHTDGRFTVAYFFKNNTRRPRSGFSNCQSIMDANDFLYESQEIDPWHFAYMHSLKGDRSITNCTTNPGHELCRR